MTTFSKRHYEAIAAVLRDTSDDIAKQFGENERDAVVAIGDDMEAGVHSVRMALMTLFEKDNPRFNRDDFQKASNGTNVARLMDAFPGSSIQPT